MPAAGDQAAVNRMRGGLRGGMKNLGVKAPAEIDDIALPDGNLAELVDRTGFIIFQIALGNQNLKG